jgi:hypothetical protein
MRHKSTVYTRETHNQFGQTEEKINLEKQKKAEHWKRDEKEGQSIFRIKEATKKQGV